MKKLVAILIALLLPSLASAAVTIRNVTGNESDGVDTFTFTHNNDGDHIGLCTVNSFGQTVTGITFNGDALSSKISATNGGTVMEFWELVNPDAGSHDVEVTLDTVAGNIRTAVISFSGVHQVTPSGTAAKLEGGLGGGTASVNVTVSAGGAAMDCFTVNGTNHAPAVGAGQTLRTSLGDDFDQPQQHATSTSTDAGTNAMNWTWTTDDNNNSLIAVPIEPAAGATSAGRPRTIVVE